MHLFSSSIVSCVRHAFILLQKYCRWHNPSCSVQYRLSLFSIEYLQFNVVVIVDTPFYLFMYARHPFDECLAIYFGYCYATVTTAVVESAVFVVTVIEITELPFATAVTRPVCAPTVAVAAVPLVNVNRLLSNNDGAVPSL